MTESLDALAQEKARVRALQAKLDAEQSAHDREVRRSASLARQHLLLQEQVAVGERWKKQACILRGRLHMAHALTEVYARRAEQLTAENAKLREEVHAHEDAATVGHDGLTPSERMAQMASTWPKPPALGVKLLREGANMPERAHQGDACLDVFANESVDIYPGATTKISLGFALDIPPGYCVEVHGRSGHDLRGEFEVISGIVDATYRGEVSAIVRGVVRGNGRFIMENPVRIAAGDKIAQMLLVKVEPLPVVQVDELSATQRGEHGFGSSGT
jgi:dUTP pyrophosphatase